MGRLKRRLGADSDAGLAERLDVTASTVANWRRRGSIPYAVCVQVAMEKGMSLDWLILGEERPELDPDAAGLAAARLESALWLLEAEDDGAEDEAEDEETVEDLNVDERVIGKLFCIYYDEFSDALERLGGLGFPRERTIELLRKWSKTIGSRSLTDAAAIGMEPSRQRGSHGEHVPRSVRVIFDSGLEGLIEAIEERLNRPAGSSEEGG